MKKTQMLVLNKDFKRIYNRGKSMVFLNFVVYYNRNRLGKTRLGITASKKIGNAVERNRARRIMKEAYRLLEELVPIGWDFVFVARGKTVKCSMNDVKNVMENFFKNFKR